MSYDMILEAKNPGRAVSPGRSPRRFRRRGTVMIFVLGILTLLALVGIGLVAATRTDAKRIINSARAETARVSTDGVVRQIQEILRKDIWGRAPVWSSTTAWDYPLTDDLRDLQNDPNLLEENNEPYDAPGEADPWLSSAVPYNMGKGVPVGAAGEIARDIDGAGNWQDILALPSVSYIGTDINRPVATPSPNPFVWADNTRTQAPVPDPVTYGPNTLRNVPLLQSPPIEFAPALAQRPYIPGSTTNVPISVSRDLWNQQVANGLVHPSGPGFPVEFPYFDTNSDGIVDLYDADGDGVPDSPLSLRIPLDGSDPNAPSAVYVAVRIIDHGAMVNVNTASSWQTPNPSFTGLTFDESAANLQRRGRRASEILLDPALHAPDRFAATGLTNAAQIMNRRRGTLNAYNPFLYDLDFLRRDLVGGLTGGFGYTAYGMSNEASLRHRGILPPSTLLAFDKTNPNYEAIDTALPWTLLWTRGLVLDNLGNLNYLSDQSRWTRFNSNYQHIVTTPTEDDYLYEGNDDPAAGAPGWRSLLQEQEPRGIPGIRRNLFTTVSYDVLPPPPGIRIVPAGSNTVLGLGTGGMRFPASSNPTQIYFMNWPVLDVQAFPDIPDPMRILPIDVNATLNPQNVEASRIFYIQTLAAAMFKALEGVSQYQGLAVDATGFGAFNRERLAWQFALNMADYRDTDGDPTVMEFGAGTGNHLYGLEKQPFFTEAYSSLNVKTETGENFEVDDEWFDAVELFVPWPWYVDASKLYLRVHVEGAPIGPKAGYRLSEFRQVGVGTPLDLDGAADADKRRGAYFVLAHNPAFSLVTLPTNTFEHSSFVLPLAAHDTGELTYELVYSAEPDGNAGHYSEHVIDVIGPHNSGKPIPDSSGDPSYESGEGFFAVRRDVDNPMPPDTKMAFSLLRSTAGWRFTTAWHQFAFEMDGVPQSGSVVPNPPPPVTQSLGRFNGPAGQFLVSDTADTLDDAIPESIWATRSVANPTTFPPLPGDVQGGFKNDDVALGATETYEAFDSVGEISRIYMIGPVGFSWQNNSGPGLHDFSSVRCATEHLARLVDVSSIGDLPDDPITRVAAGRVDFARDGATESTLPDAGLWSWRLFSYLTTQSHAFDRVDNDGDGLFDTADLDEGYNTLYRLAGRININTAPVTVLRTVPFMSLLPTSLEYQGFITQGSAVNEFNLTTTRFWDFASAIVARRDNRAIDILLPNETGQLQSNPPAARVQRFGIGGQFKEGPFASIGELTTLTNIRDILPGAPEVQQSPFRIDRFTAFQSQGNTELAMRPHSVVVPQPLGTSRFSPDFRTREFDATDYTRVDNAVNFDSGGVRGRDIYMARMSNLLTTRSDVFTAYIALIDEDGNYLTRTQVTLDRSVCFREIRNAASSAPTIPVLPEILLRTDGSYADDTR